MSEQENTLHYGVPRLLFDTTHREHAIMAGLGYGKTHCGPPWALKRCLDNLRSSDFLVIAPDNKLLKNRCLPEFESHLEKVGLVHGTRGDYKLLESNGNMQVVFRWGRVKWGQTIYFLTGESPAKITSYNAFGAWVDEPGLIHEEVFKRLYMRLRCPFANYIQLLYTGVPEGLTFFSERFSPPNVTPIDERFSESDTKLVLHGSSYDNPYLPQEYFQVLEEEFGGDPALYSNFVLGKPMSLARDRFYFNFNAGTHVVDYPIDVRNPRLILTWDENIAQMTWATMQQDANRWIVVGDNGGKGHNIEDACAQFRESYPPRLWSSHLIEVHGDASLHARSPHSYSTGYELIEHFLKPHYPRLRIVAPRSNPFVEEQSRLVNKLFAQGRLLIHKDAKRVIESAKSAQSDKNGKVKKPAGETFSHAMESVSHALMVLEPQQIVRGYQGIKSL